ncbi:hypothetical protein H310_05188 [Aphanomyces invadans]|uniref:Uncharacterized protein n=1 Tax=Aphanomyces invadans TaxID=157072 RepID=A0A024UBR1_9STRA|nr:hypothetical protein H310_05188 [Aphanomyces invadans]ETW03831.1 hypothetical protein H310_05188 [Aphanomyces invadans]|eukprot:XP_008868060.1 hypothetical protein H310_05188 [Aphanomyces invadans]
MAMTAIEASSEPPASAHTEEHGVSMVPVEAGAQDGSVMAVTSPAMFVPEVLVDCHQPQATDSRSDNSAPTPSSVFAPVDLLDVHKPTVLQFVPVDLTGDPRSMAALDTLATTSTEVAQETGMSVENECPDTIDIPNGIDKEPTHSALQPSTSAEREAVPRRQATASSLHSPATNRSPTPLASEREQASLPTVHHENSSCNLHDTSPLKFVPVELVEVRRAMPAAQIQTTSAMLDRVGRARSTPTHITESTMSGDEALPDMMDGAGEEDDVDSLDDDDDVEIAAILKEAAMITDLAIQEGRIEPFRGDHSVMNDVQQASTAIRSTSSPTLGPHQEQPVATTLFSPVELLSPTTGATAMLHEPSVGTPPHAQGFRMDTAAHRPGRTSTSTTPTYSDASTPSPPTPQHDGTKRRKRPPRAAARVSRPTTDNIQTISTLKRMAKHNAKVAHIVVTQKRPKATYPTASPTEASKAPQTPPSTHSSTKRSGTVFAKLSDAHHCRFYPKKTKASVAAMRNPACGYDFVHRGHDGDDGTAGNDFLNRMQVAEQNRRKKLETTRGEEAYMLRQSKKECPKCGMVQSFAEWRDKKKRCTFCGVLFALPKAWGDIGHAFFVRMEEDAQQREQHRHALLQKVVAHETSQNVVATSAVQRRFAKQQQQQQVRKPPKTKATPDDAPAAIDFDPPAFDAALSNELAS